METCRHLVILSSISLLLLSIFPCFIAAVRDVKCRKTKYRTFSVDEFKQMIEVFAIKGEYLLHPNVTGKPVEKTVYCETACTAWLCVVKDAVFYGGGCYPEFKETCKMSTLATSGNIDSKLNEIKYEPYTFVSIYKKKLRPFQAGYNLFNEIQGVDVTKYLDYFINDFLGVSVNIVTPPTTLSPNIDTISNNDKSDQFNDGLMNQINGLFYITVVFILSINHIIIT